MSALFLIFLQMMQDAGVPVEVLPGGTVTVNVARARVHAQAATASRAKTSETPPSGPYSANGPPTCTDDPITISNGF